MTAREYWKAKFGEYPKTDAEKLAVAMMTEFMNKKFPSPLTEQWISVKDRLPEFDVEVLTYIRWERKEKGENQVSEFFDCGCLRDVITARNSKTLEWKIGDNYNVSDVLYWMPIPPVQFEKK